MPHPWVSTIPISIPSHVVWDQWVHPLLQIHKVIRPIDCPDFNTENSRAKTLHSSSIHYIVHVIWFPLTSLPQLVPSSYLQPSNSIASSTKGSPCRTPWFLPSSLRFVNNILAAQLINCAEDPRSLLSRPTLRVKLIIHQVILILLQAQWIVM